MRFSKFTPLFLWLFFSGLILVGIIGLTLLGYWQKIAEFDKTYISFGIILIFVIGWIFSLTDMIWINRINGKRPSQADFDINIVRRGEMSSHFSRSLISAGFLGTVVGIFIVVDNLGLQISSERELEAIRIQVQGALSGMRTALLTTIIGLISSYFIELFHLVFKNAYFNLISRWENEK